MEFNAIGMVFSRCLFVVSLVIIMLLCACSGSSRSLYYWGHYEDSIFDMYLEPGKASVPDEILKLEEQIEQAKASRQFVPPGLHAHLAYLYMLQGDSSEALIHFQTEKAKFPESAHFIDGMIRRMKR